uniref:NADPH--cytochrome P450 reductase n=1 Tax=Syphacia muris TaxID=451379 RepID=A0A0N5AJD7_9BILA
MAINDVVFLYGSETGTAQDVTETLWMEAKKRHVPARLYSMDEYDIKNLSDEMCAVFVISTTGQEKSRYAENFVFHVSIAVLGLGDSSYQKYNFAAKKLYRRLCQLGAKPLLELSLADDQHEFGVDGAFDVFKKDLFRKLSQKWFSKEMSLNAESLFVLSHRYQLVYDNIHEKTPAVHPKNNDFHLFTVSSNEQVTATDHFQETHLLKLSAENESLQRYDSGDVFWLHPYNLEESIMTVVEALGYSDDVLDRKFYFQLTDSCIRKPPSWLIKEPTTLRECLTKYLDLQMVPRRSFFKKLSLLSNNKMEAEKLDELGSAHGINAYYEYCLLPRRTVAECLRDFANTSKALPPNALFDILSAIKPRAYSISSCAAIHSLIELLVAKVEYKSRTMREQRKGICSTFISRLKTGDKIFGRIGQGTFRWPNESSSLLLIGPGTGVAAFRSILNCRNQLRNNVDNIMKNGNLCSPDFLFFGCRSPKKDFYFRDEWPKLKNACVVTAFSRDDGKSEHVQDKLLQNSDEIWKLIDERDGYIYIAGRSGKMPESVINVLKKIIFMNGENGDTLIKKLENFGKLQIETWE